MRVAAARVTSSLSKAAAAFKNEAERAALYASADAIERDVLRLDGPSSKWSDPRSARVMLRAAEKTTKAAWVRSHAALGRLVQGRLWPKARR